MIGRFVVIALAVSTLGGCATAGRTIGVASNVDPSQPVAANATRVEARPIDPDRWRVRSAIVRASNGREGSVTVHTCAPPACPIPGVAIVRIVATGPSAPDRATLERIAKEEVPGQQELSSLIANASASGATNQMLASSVSTYFGRPGLAIEFARRRDTSSPTIYQASSIAFTGHLTVSVVSVSSDRAFARRNRDALIAGMRVIEGPSTPGGAAAAPVQGNATAGPLPQSKPPVPDNAGTQPVGLRRL